jgi:hypothetical protein
MPSVPAVEWPSHGRAHVPHARAGVDGDQVDAGLRAVPVDAQQQRPLLGVLVQVGGGFGDREGELADAGGGKPQPFGHNWTALRQAATALASSTRSHRMSCGDGAWSGQLSGTT